MSTQVRRLRLVLTAAIAGLAALRLLISIVPDTIFDIDPLSSGAVYPGIGPGLSVLLDAILLALVALTFEVERRGKGIDGVMLLLLVLPVGAIAVHGMGSALDMWRGVDWFTAAAVGVALAHLVRTNDCRSLAISILIGAIVITGVRGGWQLFEEHPQTVSHFNANRAEVLQMNGWEEGSSAALTYERRLLQPEATGWVGFSNIASGFYGAAAVFLFGLALAASRRAGPRGIPVGLGMLGIGMLALLLINGSKGAVAASLFGGGLILLGLLRSNAGSFFRNRIGLIVVLGGVAVVGAVIARGALKEDTLGELSLLFRSHYLDAGVSMVQAEPWLGVGPEGFQSSYPSMRPLRSPETPASAHSMWLDWVVSFGVAGCAWVVLVGVLLLRRTPRDDSREVQSVHTSVAVFASLVVFGVALGMQIFTEGSTLNLGGVFIRVFGMAIAAMTAALVAEALRSMSTGAMRRLAIAAAAVIVVHAQLEMLFWQPGSVAMAWGLLGVAGMASDGRWRNASQVWPWLLAGIAFWFGMKLMLGEAQQRRSVEPLFNLALSSEEATAEAISEARYDVATGLSSDVIADGRWWDSRRIRAGITQYALARDTKALELASAWAQGRPSTESTSLYAAVARSFSSAEAIEAVREALLWRPFAPGLHLQLASMLADEEEWSEAATELSLAQEFNAALELDPLAQFTEPQLREVSELSVRIDEMK